MVLPTCSALHSRRALARHGIACFLSKVFFGEGDLWPFTFVVVQSMVVLVTTRMCTCPCVFESIAACIDQLASVVWVFIAFLCLSYSTDLPVFSDVALI